MTSETTQTSTARDAGQAAEIIGRSCHPDYKFKDLQERCRQLRKKESDKTVLELLHMVEFLLNKPVRFFTLPNTKPMNPADMPIPPDLVLQLHITATFDLETGAWTVRCPEWQCELHDNNLTRCITILVAEIETNNHETLQGEPDWSKDPRKMREVLHCGVDHERRQAGLRRSALDRIMSRRK